MAKLMIDKFAPRWGRLGVFRKALLGVVIVLVALAFWSWVWPVAGTTGDGLNSFVHSTGRLVWKHRSSPSSDYITAVGPYYQLAFYVFSYTKVSTTDGGYVWEFDVWYLPLIAALIGVLIIASVFSRRNRKRQRTVEENKPDKSSGESA